MFKCGVFSGLYFPILRLNTELYKELYIIARILDFSRSASIIIELKIENWGR